MRLLAGAVLVAALAGTALTSTSASRAPATADVQPAATAVVTRQDLVQRTALDGTLGFGKPQKLAARAAGTLTRLPAEGASVGVGGALYWLDERPVVLMAGTVPAYRQLAAGARGADVAQLEQGLRKLGHGGFTADDSYTSATTRAVRAWQRDLGVPDTGTVQIGDVVFRPAPLRVAAHTAAVGDQLTPGAAVLDVTGTDPLVTVALEVSKRQLLRDTAPVAVQLPDGRTLPGRVTAISTASQAPGDSEQKEPAVDVTVTLKPTAGVGAVEQTPVQVWVDGDRRSQVLTVPVIALLALAEGGYGVYVVEPSGTGRVVPVKPGLFADGRVELSGTGLRDGMTVEVPAS